MKIKHLFIVGSLLALLLAACNQKMDEVDSPIPAGEVTFNAVFGDAPNTRTTVVNETDVWWSPNDAINVYYGNLTSGKFTSTIAEESATSQFTGSFTAVTGTLETGCEVRSFWATYPYDVRNSCDGSSVTLTVPTLQKGEVGTFRRNTFPSIATSNGLDLAFYNVCGGMVITVVRDDIRVITLKGNNGEILAGTVRVAFVDDDPAVLEVVEGEQAITFRSPDNKPFIPGSRYFITALPVAFSLGYSLTFVTQTGEVGTRQVTDAKTIRRSRFLVVNDADANVSFAAGGGNANLIHFVDLELKDCLVAAFDKDADGELSYDEAASVSSPEELVAAFGGNKSYQSFEEFQYFTGITQISESMFNGWNQLTRIVLPGTVTVIGGSAFRDCSQLESIRIPDGVGSIGGSAFYGCAKITGMILPEGTESIGGYAFYGCSSLLDIHIPNSVSVIGNQAFQNCTSLRSISISNNITSIGYSAFSGCSSITHVYFEGAEQFYKVLSSGGDIPWGSSSQLVHLYFAGTEITSLAIPEEITKIRDRAFRHMGYLTSVTLHDGVTRIGSNAFELCESLVSISIPGSCQTIGNYAFYHCHSLVSATLSEGVSTIQAHVFNDCNKLVTFEFPASIRSIGMSVLQVSKSLKSITVKAVEVPTIDDGIAGSSFDTNCPIYVPEESLQDYKTAQGWKNYASRIMPILAEGDDPSVSNNVKAQFLGGAVSISNGLILPNSSLSYGVYNNSDKSIEVMTLQLKDGVTGAVGNMMSLNRTISPGSDAGWTVTVGTGGIHSPIAIFVYRCEDKRYEIRVPYPM